MSNVRRGVQCTSAKMKNKKGITLIALVITVIVLLILAGIALSLVLGENGITERAVNAGKTQNIAGAKEKVELDVANYASEFYQAKYINNEGVNSIQDYVLGKLNPIDYTPDYVLTKNTSAKTVTLTSNIGSDRTTATATIDENGKVTWGSTSIESASGNGGSGGGGGNTPLEIPDDLTVGSTISWTPSGSYHWDADLATSYNNDGTLNDWSWLVDDMGYDADDIGSDYEYADKYLYSGSGASDLISAQQADSEDFTITSWKVLNINNVNNTVDIVPVRSSFNQANFTGFVTLQGAQGYNNAVNLLDEACSNLYGDEAHGITARSIDMDDLEELMDPDTLATAKRDNNYGKYYSEIYTDNFSSDVDSNGEYTTYKSYPKIWEQEDGGTLGLSSKLDSMLARADQIKSNNGIWGALTPSSGTISPKKTYYYMDSSTFSSALGSKNFIAQNDDYYWVASRCVYLNYDICNFYVRIVNGGELSSSDLFYSGDSTYGDGLGLFPVVSLSSGVLSGNNSTGFTFAVE